MFQMEPSHRALKKFHYWTPLWGSKRNLLRFHERVEGQNLSRFYLETFVFKVHRSSCFLLVQFLNFSVCGRDSLTQKAVLIASAGRSRRSNEANPDPQGGDWHHRGKYRRWVVLSHSDTLLTPPECLSEMIFVEFYGPWWTLNTFTCSMLLYACKYLHNTAFRFHPFV